MASSSHGASFYRVATILFAAILATGCAATPGRTSGEDPWEGFNRSMYKFNDTIDRAALKPVAKGYKKVTPNWIRRGIGNFFANLEYPITIANQFLQGKAATGLKDTGRFLLNSTIGVAGIFDVATPVGLDAHDEDFGQTLAVWGVPSGPYLTIPLFGPSTLRDGPSRGADFFNPLTYGKIHWEEEWALRMLDVVHTRAELLTLDPTLERAFDPYAFVRDAWIQRREFEIFDGSPPPETLDEEFLEEGDALPPDETTTNDTPAAPLSAEDEQD
jgi:phospholipid-binding lipoprotein MlaA